MTLEEEVGALRGEVEVLRKLVLALREEVVAKRKKTKAKGTAMLEVDDLPEIAPRPGAEALVNTVEIDVPLERSNFQQRTGETPEAWLARWRAGKIPQDGASWSLSYRAALLEDSTLGLSPAPALGLPGQGVPSPSDPPERPSGGS